MSEHIISVLEPKARLVRSTPLDDATSATVIELEIALPTGEHQRLALRRYTDDRHHVGRQYRLLETLRGTEVPVAKPRYVDESTHTLVCDYIDGEPGHRRSDGEHVADQMARTLLTIHRTTPPDFLPGTGTTLLHGDFWPGNTIWRDDQLVAVIDWEDAGVGDPLADVANARCELSMFFGAAARTAFTEVYRDCSTIDLSSLPAWDLAAAQRPAEQMTTWGLDEVTLTRLRAGLGEFLGHAHARTPCTRGTD